MIDHSQTHEFVLDKLWFSFKGQRFTGRGLLRWSPKEGFRLDGFLNERLSGTMPYSGGTVTVQNREDAISIRMNVSGYGRAFAPNLLPRYLHRFLQEGRISLQPERVIFFRHSTFIPDLKNVYGTIHFSVVDDLHFPDTLEKKTLLNGKLIGKSSKTGLSYEDFEGFSLWGTQSETDFRLTCSFPVNVWTNANSWSFAEAARRALSIVFGQMIWIVKRETTRGRKEILELREKRDANPLGFRHRLIAERPIISQGIVGQWQFNKEVFIKLTDFFLKDKNVRTSVGESS